MKDDKVYLLHIQDAIRLIEEFTSDGKGTFLRDAKTRDAVIRNLEIIGEATKKLSDQLKSKHPEIEWKRIAGMRDKMIHEYFGVNLELVWDVVEKKLPALKKKIEETLK